MDITEVRIKLMDEGGERLQAFCSITFDDSFVIRDLKIIEGSNGPFVAMPSRKLTSHCPQCGTKNHLRSAYCNHCGGRLKDDRLPKDEDGRAKLYADIAHPINSACREMIQERVIREFHVELDRAKLPGYVSRYDDFDSDDNYAPPSKSAAQLDAVPPRPHLDASKLQPAEQRPRSMPRPAAARPTAQNRPEAHSRPEAPTRPDTPSRSEAPSRPTAPPPSRPETPPGGSRDGFGAGIFG